MTFLTFPLRLQTSRPCAIIRGESGACSDATESAGGHGLCSCIRLLGARIAGTREGASSAKVTKLGVPAGSFVGRTGPPLTRSPVHACNLVLLIDPSCGYALGIVCY